MKQDSENPSLATKLLERVTSSWMAQAIYVAAELRIADLLSDGPKSSEDLAVATGSHASSLYRLLRALTTIEICKECADGVFEITPMGSLLRTDDPQSLRYSILWWGTNLWKTWGNLLYSIKTGESARKLLAGTTGFEHLERDPEAAAVFNRSLVELTRLTAESVIRAYDFSGLKRIMDVGGGYGEMLIAILRANPAASGVLFDLPHAVEGGRRHLEAAGLGSRCEFLSGNFFESVPSGANAYLLKSVIHDWDDENSKRILQNCRRALEKGGRLLLVERTIPERLEISAVHQALVRGDLTMLVAHAAPERTEAEFRNLLNSAGFETTRIFPTDSTFCVIEAVSL
jgi:ubiquinone/menaquinone biosynthesis C-methylase UbiE